MLELEVNEDETSGKIRVVLINDLGDSKYPEIWMIELTVNGSLTKLRKEKTTWQRKFDYKDLNPKYMIKQSETLIVVSCPFGN